jgi:hypothetical protein
MHQTQPLCLYLYMLLRAVRIMPFGTAESNPHAGQNLTCPPRAEVIADGRRGERSLAGEAGTAGPGT